MCDLNSSQPCLLVVSVISPCSLLACGDSIQGTQSLHGAGRVPGGSEMVAWDGHFTTATLSPLPRPSARPSWASCSNLQRGTTNDPKCRELGWVCIPLAVESYGCWGEEAHSSFSRLAARLALQLQCSKSKATTTIYQRLNLTLVRCNARAMLSRARLLQSADGG